MPSFADSRLATPALKGRPYQVITGAAAILEDPADTSRWVTQALHGETLRVFDQAGAFAQVQLDRDRYVGWVRLADLSGRIHEPTHKVCTVRTHTYPAADLKLPTVSTLSLGARVHVVEVQGDWADCGRSGWVPMRHLSPLNALETDVAGIAERFFGTPYVWGGRESLGIDCTGLTQQAFEACGVLMPRDSDMQAAWCGTDIPDWRQPGALKRGDLVFWKGHVGIMLSSQTLLHANAWHMAVAKEALSTAIDRIKTYYAEPTGARRIDLSQQAEKAPVWL